MQTTKLCIHCGSNRVSEERVINSFTPPADERDISRPWTPIPHGDFFHLVKSSVEARGLSIAEADHALQDSGDILDAKYFGLLRLASDENPDWSPLIGIRNSHNRTISAQLVVGGFVFVCDNMMFSGEIRVGHKHTRKLLEDLPVLIEGAITSFLSQQDFQNSRYQKYKEAQLENDHAIHLLTRLSMEHEVLPWAFVKSAIEEWSQPTHEEHEQYGNSVWRLMNAVTEVLKPTELRNPDRIHGRGRRPNATVWGNPDKTIKLHRILDQVAGI